jgi:hypothetical protein
MTTLKKPSKDGIKKTVTKQPATEKRKVGRPTIKTDVLKNELCRLIAEDGLSARKACITVGLTFQTFWEWLSKDKEFTEQYTRAKELQAENYADQIVEIADEPPELVVDDAGAARIDSAFVQHQKIRIDSRKWVASRLLPKKYGDKIQQEVTGANGGPIQQSIVTPEQLDEAIKNGIRNKF